jgi:hypothetical protein
MKSIAAIRPARKAVLAFMGFGLLALGIGMGPASAATPEQAPPLAAGAARVWFLRQLLPGTAMHAPMIYVDGAPIAESAEGTAFYRDFAPGTYRFSVENCLPEPGTSQTLTLRPNTQLALEVTSDENGPGFYCTPSQISYLRPAQPQMLPYEFARLTYLGAK